MYSTAHHVMQAERTREEQGISSENRLPSEEVDLPERFAIEASWFDKQLASLISR